MTGDQWYSLLSSAIIVIGIIGGALAGAYIVRKSK